MKYSVFSILFLLINISCRTDTNINDIAGNNYITPLDVYRFIAPAEGETWVTGSVKTIKWVSPDNTNPVDITVIKKKNYYETLIVKNYPNSGSYKWQVPVDLPPSNHYQIKISDNRNPANVSYSDVFYIH